MTDETDGDSLSESYGDARSNGRDRSSRTRRGVLALILLAISGAIVWVLDTFLPGGYGVGGYGSGGFGD